MASVQSCASCVLAVLRDPTWLAEMGCVGCRSCPGETRAKGCRGLCVETKTVPAGSNQLQQIRHRAQPTQWSLWGLHVKEKPTHCMAVRSEEHEVGNSLVSRDQKKEERSRDFPPAHKKTMLEQVSTLQSKTPCQRRRIFPERLSNGRYPMTEQGKRMRRENSGKENLQANHDLLFPSSLYCLGQERR